MKANKGNNKYYEDIGAEKKSVDNPKLFTMTHKKYPKRTN